MIRQHASDYAALIGPTRARCRDGGRWLSRDAYQKGAAIRGLSAAESRDSKVFHAGTQQSGKDIVTAGGRVLCACALGDTIAEAQNRAYRLVRNIDWDNVYYRTDIGFKAIGRNL